jgi:hypothetical protein
MTSQYREVMFLVTLEMFQGLPREENSRERGGEEEEEEEEEEMDTDTGPVNKCSS